MNIIATSVGVLGLLLGLVILLTARRTLSGIQLAGGVVVFSMLCADYFNRFPEEGVKVVKALFALFA